MPDATAMFSPMSNSTVSNHGSVNFNQSGVLSNTGRRAIASLKPGMRAALQRQQRNQSRHSRQAKTEVALSIWPQHLNQSSIASAEAKMRDAVSTLSLDGLTDLEATIVALTQAPEQKQKPLAHARNTKDNAALVVPAVATGAEGIASQQQLVVVDPYEQLDHKERAQELFPYDESVNPAVSQTIKQLMQLSFEHDLQHIPPPPALR